MAGVAGLAMSIELYKYLGIIQNFTDKYLFILEKLNGIEIFLKI